MIYLDRQNVQILAPLHDGFLLTCRHDQLGELRQAVDFALGNAVEHVLPGFPMRWDFEVYPDRFEDEDGRAQWRQILGFVDGPASGDGARCGVNRIANATETVTWV